MKKLLKYFKGYKKECVLAPLFKMLEAILELFVPLAVKKIIDVGIAGGDSGYILKMCLVLGTLGLAGLLMSVCAQFFAAKAAVGFSSRLRGSLFAHIMSFGYPEADSLGTDTLITRMTDDIDLVQNGVNLTLRLLLRSPFVVFGAVIMAYTVEKSSLQVFGATVPLLSVAVFGIMLGTMPLYRAVRRKLDGVTSGARQNLSGVRVIRAFGLEEKEIADFKRRTEEHFSAEKRAGRISALLNPVTYVLINLAVIVLIYTGAIKVNTGLITQGAVVALYNYMSQILVELIKLADLIISISKALTGANRISDVLSRETSVRFPEKGAVPDFSASALEFRNVSMRYGKNSENSLESISFTVNPGETFGIVGSTGSGKTSIVNLIPGFYSANEGQVRIFGNDIRDYSQKELSRLVAVVPQKAVLFSGTIRDNLKWGNENATDEDIYNALKIAQAENVVSSKKNGLDEQVEEGGKNFSGGQRQRLTIARALLKNAPILILDDSSSALDGATDLRLRTALKNLPGKPCVILISQRATCLTQCSSIAVLENGKIEAVGTHEELLTNSGIYREFTQTADGVSRGAEK